VFAIKAEVTEPGAKAFAPSKQKTMYGGKHIVRGDTIFVFASENEGGPGLLASGIVTSAEAVPKKRGIAAPQHHHQAHRAREATLGEERAQTLLQVERRSTRDRAQLQIVSSSNERDCGHLR
jgi:hypothetical protein